MRKMLIEYYQWIKAFHVVAMVAWMGGILYLPRLFVYHTQLKINSEEDKLFQVMERRLLRIIMNPAMIITIILGVWLASLYGWENLGVWFHIKLTSILVLSAMHMLCAKWRKDFEKGKNKHSAKFYRIANEIPTILMIIAVIMVIVKPFE
jgi:putative membrane protein